jgi:Ca2+-binding EF-hand superfamily protein
MVYFDKDKDKCLNEVEFRNCITGLGLVVSDDTVASKLAASTTGERKLNFDEFAAFMVEMVRVSLLFAIFLGGQL